MSAEQNKAIVLRFYEELWNQRRIDIADELVAPECVTHQLRSGADVVGVPRGPAAIKRHVAEWLSGFPDLRFDVEQIIAGDGEVVTRSVMHGTHTGDWHGVAATGRRIGIRMVVIQRIADGRIAEDWVLVESLGLWQQLGLLPATDEILARAGK